MKVLAIFMTLCLASSAFASQEAELKGLFGWMIDTLTAGIETALGFSLSTLWQVIIDIGGALYAQFILVMTQLVFAGTAILNQVYPIFEQLYYDVTTHIMDAGIYIEAALNQIQTILLTGGKRATDEQVKMVRGIFDALLDILGLTQVWDIILSVGGALLQQFMNVLTQLLFVGQSVLNQVIPIFTQLATDLMNHAADAVPLITNALAQVTVLLG